MWIVGFILFMSKVTLLKVIAYICAPWQQIQKICEWSKNKNNHETKQLSLFKNSNWGFMKPLYLVKGIQLSWDLIKTNN